MISVKYRVEEHYANSSTYLLHGTYDNLQSAKNKVEELISSGIKKERLSIIVETKIITRRIVID